MTTGHSLQTLPPTAAPLDWDSELNGARALYASGLCPKALRTPEAVLFVILAGRDFGLSPVRSLRSLHIIDGKIEVAADLQLGLFHARGGTSKWVVLTVSDAVLELTAPWLDAPHQEKFTMEDAARAQLANKENWKKFPKAMLRSRCITAALKSIGFDATAGAYAPGEIGGPEEEPETLEAIEATPVTVTKVETEPGDAAEEDYGSPEAEATERRRQADLLVAMSKHSAWTEDEAAKLEVFAERVASGDVPLQKVADAIDRYTTFIQKRAAGAPV